MNRRPGNIEVRARSGESPERLLRRFIKKCKNEEIVKEYIDKTLFYKSKRSRRRDKKSKAIWFRKLEQSQGKT